MLGTVRGWFDERVDQTSGRTIPILGLRLVIALIIATLTALTLGPTPGAIWALCAASAELGTWLTTAASRRDPRRTLKHRLAYLAAVLWMNIVWSGLAVALWESETSAGVLAAVCMVATQMLHAATFANRSPALLFAIAGPPVLVLGWLTWFGVGDDLKARLMAIGGAGIMVAYMAMAARLAGSQSQAAETGKARCV